jgi:predicted transcriptional regulator of viral defense system
MTTSELKAFGVSAYYIQKYLEKDTITRISHGLYKLNSEMVDEWLEVSRLVEKGIFCLFSAAQLWDLTTFVSSEYHLALPSKAKITMPGYPPIKIYYWHPLHYKIGITVFDQSQFDLPIYDKEKTVCDFLKYRNKVGLDTVKEVVNNRFLWADSQA